MLKKPYAEKLTVLAVFALVYTIVFFILAVTLPYSFPFLVALLIAALLQRPLGFLGRKLRLNRTAGSLILVVLVLGLVALVLWLIGLRLVQEISGFIAWLATLDYTVIAEQIITPATEFVQRFITLDAEFIQQNTESIMSILRGSAQVVNYALGTVLRLVSSVPQIMMTVVVLFLSSFYFTKDLPKFLGFLHEAVGDRLQSIARKTWSQSFVLLGKYVKAYLLIYSIDAVYTLIVFFALRLPYAALLALAAIILDLLPAIGLGFAYGAIAIWMLIQGNVLTAALLMVFWIIINLARQYLEPKLVSQSIQVYPLTMLAVFFIAIRMGSFVAMVYLTLLVLLYALLRQAGIFEELIPIVQRGIARIKGIWPSGKEQE